MDFLWFLLLLLLPLLLLLLLLPLLCDLVAGAGAAVPVSAATGAADLAHAAAIEAAAKPKVNKAVVIKVADLFMRSPNVGVGQNAENTTGIRRFHRDEDHFTIPR